MARGIRAGVVIICAIDIETVTVPDPSCPRAELHTPCPPGYLNWFEWAAKMNYRGSQQSRCPGCQLYHVWSSPRRGPAKQ